MNGRDGVRDMMYIMIYHNYSHMASVNEQMLTNSEWIAFQQEANFNLLQCSNNLDLVSQIWLGILSNDYKFSELLFRAGKSTGFISAQTLVELCLT